MIRFIVIFISCVGLFFACHTNQNLQTDHNYTVPDNLYDTEFPKRDIHPEIDPIIKSVVQINVMAFYRGYKFSLASQVTPEQLKVIGPASLASETTFFQKPASGAATILYLGMDKAAMLTCAHIVDFPDTIYSYHKTDNLVDTPFLRSIAIKKKQTNNIPTLADLGNFEIIIADSDIDIALIGAALKPNIRSKITPLSIPIGKAADLRWGTFTYLIGYPQGKKMISSGLVSSPNRDKKHSFYVDVALPRGLSGGPVIAIRDGVPNFELVGMANAVAAKLEYFLTPDASGKHSLFETAQNYQGEINVKPFHNLYYGVTFVISAEIIRKFISDNIDFLRMKGYLLKF